VSDISFEWEMSASSRQNVILTYERREEHTFASDGPKTSTLLTCNSWLWAAPGEATQEPVRRTAAPTARLHRRRQ
jgi:hypothetical protein